MGIKNYDELNSIAKDMFKEIGSIGTGSAATALSSALSEKITMSIPEVNILEFNNAIEFLGGPEKIIAATIVRFSGSISGMMLYLLDLDFCNFVIQKLGLEPITRFEEVEDISISAITEISNIIISSYISAIAQLTDISISLSVPALCVNMQGGIMSVPIIEYGYITDSIMMMGGKFKYGEEEMSSTLIMLPDIKSLNFLLEKLGVYYE